MSDGLLCATAFRLIYLRTPSVHGQAAAVGTDAARRASGTGGDVRRPSHRGGRASLNRFRLRRHHPNSCPTAPAMARLRHVETFA
jgi:hypothetical protein